MRIKSKFIVGGLALALIPLLTSSIITTMTAGNLAEDSLTQTAEQLLTADRQAQTDTLSEYVHSIEGVLLTQAANPTVIEAMKNFTKSFGQFPEATPQMKAQVTSFYENQFGSKFAKKNPNMTAPVSQMTNSLDNDSWYMQYQYIAANPAELGAKDELPVAQDGSEYAQWHEKYHGYMRSLLLQFSLYDIFLVEPNSGDVIYSVFKELDYSTSLKSGPYAQSGIGEAFKAGLNLSANKSFLTEFSSYLPSYNDPASFMSTPIVENGKTIGVLIFQMPLGHINSLVTHNQKWEQVGLGETGQTLLLGSDGLLLNETRTFIENSNQSIADYSASGLVSASTLSKLQSNESSVGLDLYKSAIQGITAPTVRQSQNPAGQSTLQAIQPMDLNGKTFYVISEISTAEVNNSISALKSSLLSLALTLIAGFGVLAFVSIGFFANNLLAPLMRLIDRSNDLANSKGADLTQTLDSTSGDEIGDVCSGLNGFFHRLRKIVSEVNQATSESENAALKLGDISLEVLSDVDEQTQRTTMVATATSEMLASVHDVSKSVEQAARNISECNDMTKQTKAGFDSTVARLKLLDAELVASGNVVNQLAAKTTEIGTVLNVIRDIADQTNLLALNAAIEAARAGEQGRGFAVVADEVRKLASRTRESTSEVDSIISELRAESDAAVGHTHSSSQLAKETILAFEEANILITNLTHTIGSIEGEISQVATAAEEQNTVTEDIAQTLEVLGNLSEQVQERVTTMNESVQFLNQRSQEAQRAVGVFKV